MMTCVECENCGSVIKREFKECPYCDFQIRRGRFWTALAALSRNAALQQARKKAPVLINLD
jgi:hypothetical protein